MNPQSQPVPKPSAPPQVVQISRPHQPQAIEITPEIKKRHDESKAKYPRLNLSPGEYVISAISRHPFGLIRIWVICGLIIAVLAALLGLLINAPANTADTIGASATSSLPLLSIPVLFAIVIVAIGGAIGTFVFTANMFYLTNESVIQNIQSGLFTKRLQTVSLGNIEDASFTQNGIIPHIFGYGSIRLSTEGEETTYRFDYTSQPEKQIAILNNAVEAFKHGRPVEG